MQNTKRKLEYLIQNLKPADAEGETPAAAPSPPLPKPEPFNEHDVPHLITILQTSNRITQRAVAARILGKLGVGGKPVLKLLIDTLEDKNHVISKSAMLALTSFPNALPYLIECLHSANSTVQMRAIRTLQAMGHAAIAALPDLEKCQEEGDAMIRMCAKMAITKILKE
jgi:HEAT repeat protein